MGENSTCSRGRSVKDGINMGQSQKSFEDKLQYGRDGELSIAEIMKSRGWYVIPSYDYSGKGDDKSPKLVGADKGYAVPDLDVAKKGKRFWIEVKRKSTATLHRKTQILEHGIPLRLYHDYKFVEQETGCEVWLFIIEDDSADVLCAKLSDLATKARICDGDKMSRGGMIFFPRENFVRFGKLNRIHGPP
jgi:hypothetical protein